MSDNNGNLSNTPTVTVAVNPINDVPVISGVSGSTGYLEGDWLTPLALTNASVTDPDFHGGTLTAKITANAHADDRLGIRWGGGNPLTIEGSVIKHNNVAVATFSGGEGSAPLVVALNSNSTATVARDILRQISYRNNGNNPGNLTRTISVTLNDGASGSNSPTVSVTVTPTVPVIGGIGSAVTFTEDGSPVLVFPSATVTGPNAFSYNGGAIVVSYLSGRGGADRLDVLNTSLITVNATAKTLSFGGAVFATYSGEGWSPTLTISFNAASSRASAEAALRAIAFSNTNVANPSTNDRVLKVQLSDSSGGTWDDQIVHVTAVNDAPVAAGDSYNLVVNRSNLSLAVAAPGVLANDIDVDGAITAQLVTPTSHGILHLFANGAFTYSPNPGFIGQDSFTYRAFDGALYSAVQTVTINVSNPSPVAQDNSYTVPMNGGFTVSAPGVLLNDSDANDTQLTATLINNVQHGVLVLNSNGSFSYSPMPGWSGTDTSSRPLAHRLEA